MTKFDLQIDWNLLILLTISFALSAIAGAAGWAMRMGSRYHHWGCFLASVNCGFAGMIGAGTVLRSAEDSSYLTAFLTGLGTGWTMGRYGSSKFPEWMGRFKSAVQAFFDSDKKGNG